MRFTGCAIGLPDDECGFPGCLTDDGVCLMPYPPDDLGAPPSANPSADGRGVGAEDSSDA